MRSPSTSRPPVIKHVVLRVLKHSPWCFRFLVLLLIGFALLFRRGQWGWSSNSVPEAITQLAPFTGEGHPPCAVFMIGVPIDNIASLVPQVQTFLDPTTKDPIKKDITFTQVCDSSEECARSSTVWGGIEDRLLARGGYVGDVNWKSPPFWMGWGYVDNAYSPHDRDDNADALIDQDEFVNEADEEVDKLTKLSRATNSNMWFVYSPRLFTTVGSWLRLLRLRAQRMGVYSKASPNLNAVCVIVTHLSRTQQLLFALSTLRQRHLSGKELMMALDYLYAHSEDRCRRAGARIVWLVRSKTGSWQMSNYAPSYVKQHPDADVMETTLSQVWDEAVDKKINIRSSTNPTSTWPKLQRVDDEAYVAVLTASNTLYAKGAMVLGRSLAFFDSSRERILLATSDVDESVANVAVRLGGWTLKRIDKVEQSWFRQCKWRSTRLSQEIRWGEMASKLRIFDMIEKKSLLYLDADVVATGRVGDLFTMLSATPELRKLEVISEGGIQHEYVNAGVMFVRPNHDTFMGMLKHYEEKKPLELFGNLIDCTEMGLINAYFGKPVKLVSDGKTILPVQNNLAAAAATTRTATLGIEEKDKATFGRPDILRDYSKHAPFVVHFMREDKCEKPWKVCAGAIEPGDRESKDFVLEMRYDHCSSFPYAVWCLFHFGTLSTMLYCGCAFTLSSTFHIMALVPLSHSTTSNMLVVTGDTTTSTLTEGQITSTAVQVRSLTQAVTTLANRQEAGFRWMRWSTAVTTWKMRVLERQIMQGRQAIANLEGDVSELEETVKINEAELAKVKQELSVCVDRLSVQEHSLEVQGTELAKLRLARLKREALIELCLVLLSASITQSSLFRASSTLLPVKNKFVRQSAQLIVFMAMIRFLRNHARQMGLLSPDGTVREYMTEISSSWGKPLLGL